jgi:hypothetical protein
MFGRKLEPVDSSLPLPTGYVSKPLDLRGWLYGRTLIASDGIVQSRELGEIVGRKAGPKEPMPIRHLRGSPACQRSIACS